MEALNHCFLTRRELRETLRRKGLLDQVAVPKDGVAPARRVPRGSSRRDGPIVLHLYAVTSWTGAPRNRSPEEHSEVSWFAVEDACRLALAHPDYPEILRAAVSVETVTDG